MLPTDGGYAEIVSRNSGQCLSVFGNSTSARRRLVQYPCFGGADQQWYYTGGSGNLAGTTGKLWSRSSAPARALTRVTRSTSGRPTVAATSTSPSRTPSADPRSGRCEQVRLNMKNPAREVHVTSRAGLASGQDAQADLAQRGRPSSVRPWSVRRWDITASDMSQVWRSAGRGDRVRSPNTPGRPPAKSPARDLSADGSAPGRMAAPHVGRSSRVLPVDGRSHNHRSQRGRRPFLFRSPGRTQPSRLKNLWLDNQDLAGRTVIDCWLISSTDLPRPQDWSGGIPRPRFRGGGVRAHAR